MRPGVRAGDFRIAVHPGGDKARRAFMRFRKAQLCQIRQMQRAFTADVCFTFGAGLGNVAKAYRSPRRRSVPRLPSRQYQRSPAP